MYCKHGRFFYSQDADYSAIRNAIGNVLVTQQDVLSQQKRHCSLWRMIIHLLHLAGTNDHPSVCRKKKHVNQTVNIMFIMKLLEQA